MVEALGRKLAPANDPRTPEGQNRYIERQEALAIQPDGSRVLFTNIDPDAEKRAEFWRLVEENETDAGPDRMTFTVADNVEFWKRAAAHPECPERLSSAIVNSDPAKRVTVDTDDNVEMRRFLSTVEGWDDGVSKREGESRDEYNARRANRMAKFHDGRGGRVQYRIIGELPHELDVKGRASILREFSDEFERRKLPFVAVMHAPDHTNSDKNWHFHLVYYDRPCRRLTAEDVAMKPADPNPKNVPVDPVGQEVVGRWDFTVVEKYKTSSREIRERRPFAQDKVKEVAQDKNWIEKLRSRLSVITNDHLEKADVVRRVDPRRHSEMGIHSDPQEHLGTKLANLEAMGIATPVGISNEERQWEAVQRKLDGDIDRRRNGVDRTARRWLQQAERAKHLDDAQKAVVRAEITRWHQHRTEAEEHLAIAENLDQHIDRTMSRANKVLATCEQQIKAIDGGSATRFQASRLQHLSVKAQQASEWLASTSKILEQENALAKRCREASERERRIADPLELSIETALKAPSIREIAADDRRRAAEDQERQREAARVRDAEDKARQAVTRKAMDDWIKEIVRTQRRLVMVDRVIRPAVVTPADRDVVDAANYTSMQSRLAGVKRQQDALVDEIVAAIRKDPRNVATQFDANGRETGSYVLVTTSKAQAEAFVRWSDDPAIAKARDEAVAVNAASRRDRLRPAERPAPVTTREGDRPADVRRTPETVRPEPVAPARTAPVSDNARGSEGDAGRRARTPAPDLLSPSPEAAERQAARSAVMALQERVVRAVRDDAIRVTMRDGVAAIPDRAMAALGIDEAGLRDRALQKRLEGVAKVQSGEINRVVGFARKNPARLVDRDGRVSIPANAPPGIRDLARRWEKDDALAITLAAIRREHLDVGKATAPETPRERVPAPEVRRPSERAATPVATPDADAHRSAPATPAERPRAPAPAPEPTRSKFSDIRPDHEMREQARQAALEAERRRTAEASRTERPTREQITGEDGAARAVRIAAEKAGTVGAHPLIDRWRQALLDEVDTDTRRLIAKEIEDTPAAQRKLVEIDRKVARRIREDAQQARDAMQPGLGLDLDRGMTPRR